MASKKPKPNRMAGSRVTGKEIVSPVRPGLPVPTNFCEGVLVNGGLVGCLGAVWGLFARLSGGLSAGLLWGTSGGDLGR